MGRYLRFGRRMAERRVFGGVTFIEYDIVLAQYCIYKLSTLVKQAGAISHYGRSRTNEIKSVTFPPQYNRIFRPHHRL